VTGQRRLQLAVATDSGGVDEELARGLASLLSRTVKRSRHVRHGALAVARVDGSWQWEGVCGEANATGMPMTTATRYPIASVTKLFTAAVTMLLQERGQLALQDRVIDILPREITQRLHVLHGVDRTGDLTVEHLLSNTSGLPDYFTEAARGGRSAQARLLAGEDAPMPFEEVLRLVKDDLKPHFPPQPREGAARLALYSNTNYQLLGAVLEAVTGQPLRSTFDSLVLAPLGLDETSTYPSRPRSGGSPEPAAVVWFKNTELRPAGTMRHQVADGGMVSTLGDQVRFLRAVVHGDFFAEPTTWGEMHTRTTRVFFPVDYGLGVMRYAPPRWMSPLFRVPPLLGHTGSTATWLFHCPDLRVIVAGTFDVAQPALPFRFLPQVLRLVAANTRQD